MARRIPPRHQNKPQDPGEVKLKKNDTVKVIAGRDRGKTGRVLDVDRDKGRVLVEHVSMIKRHTRPNPPKQIKGGIAERESSIAVSNVMIVTVGRRRPRAWATGWKARAHGCGSPQSAARCWTRSRIMIWQQTERALSEEQWFRR